MYSDKFEFHGTIPLLLALTDEYFVDSEFVLGQNISCLPDFRIDVTATREFTSVGIYYEHWIRVTAIPRFDGVVIASIWTESEFTYNLYGREIKRYKNFLSNMTQ